MLICPVCGAPLERSDRALRCAGGHSFDLSASGYCNLLTGTKPGEFTGDSREMIAARRLFLDTGAYAPLRDAVCSRLAELAPGRTRLAVDAGCGEGYYTRAMAETLAGLFPGYEIFGADISKAATQYAAKRDKLTRYVTASVYRLPFSDGCAGLITSLFAPAPPDEFARILSDGGAVVQAVPGEDHLIELKEAVYDTAYKNVETKHSLDGFVSTGCRKLTYGHHLDTAEQIRALFSMTPYVHRTPREGIERLNALTELDVTLSFLLLTYEKKI